MRDFVNLFKSDKFLKPYYVRIVVAIRLLVPIYIIVNPLWGFIGNCLADYFDAYFIKHKAGLTWKEYHLLDKNLDWFSYACMYVASAMRGLGTVLLFWLGFRLIGQLVFLHKRETKYFIFFPNIFEFMFVWFVILKWQLNFNGFGLPFWFWFVILVLLKEIQEIWLHHFWPKYLKTNGYPKFLQRLGYESSYI